MTIMREHDTNFYVCPLTKESLTLKLIQNESDHSTGVFTTESGNEYIISDGIPKFTIRNIKENDKNEYAIDLFKKQAKEYDKYQHLSFETFYQDEVEVRNSLIDKLNLNPSSTVLEVNAGTGRDSLLIAKRLSKDGLLHVQDISREMLEICKLKLSNIEVPIAIHEGDASKLPYRDKSFDAVYSFGGVGMNTYLNNYDAIAELVRVTKINGRIVIGGLSLAPWLRKTLFGKVLTNHNSHYANEISLNDLPIQARDLNLQWILSGAGFVIDFSVGEGEPSANFNYEIPGIRGGTHLTRYFGKLEGVSPKTKEMAEKAREKLGISMHKMLDEIIMKESLSIINKKD